MRSLQSSYKEFTEGSQYQGVVYMGESKQINTKIEQICAFKYIQDLPDENRICILLQEVQEFPKCIDVYTVYAPYKAQRYEIAEH